MSSNRAYADIRTGMIQALAEDHTPQRPLLLHRLCHRMRLCCTARSVGAQIRYFDAGVTRFTGFVGGVDHHRGDIFQEGDGAVCAFQIHDAVKVSGKSCDNVRTSRQYGFGIFDLRSRNSTHVRKSIPGRRAKQVFG